MNSQMALLWKSGQRWKERRLSIYCILINYFLDTCGTDDVIAKSTDKV